MRPIPDGWLARLSRLSDLALCFVRKWWRPAICVSIGGSIIVNGMVVPLITHAYPDLTGLAAMIAAASPFAWLRTHEKIKGAVN